MADYDLGTAHGQVVITYDGKGSKQADDDFKKIEKSAESVDKKLKAAAAGIVRHFRDIDNGVARTARQFGVLTGGIAILAGLSSATGKFGGALLSLRGGGNILGALGTTMGGLPKSVQGFPKIIKNFILLSSAITLVAGSTKLIGGVVQAITRMGTIQGVLARASGAVTGFAKSASRFPVIGGIVAAFATRFRTSIFSIIGGMDGAGDSIKNFGSKFDGWGKPIHMVARLALTIGTLIQGVKATMGVAKYIGMFGAGFAALGGAINIVAGLGAAIKQLSGLLGVVPAAMGAVAFAAGTLMVGVKGMGDAFKAVAEGDAAALDEALKKLAPSAREVVLAVRDQKPAWDALQLDVQQRLFAGLGPLVNALGTRYMPILRGAMGGVADSFNRAATEVMNYFNNAELAGDVSEGFEFTRQIIDNLVSAFPPLVEAFHIIGRVGAEVLAEVTKGARGAAMGFREFIGEARASGKLAEWMRGGIQALRDLWAISRDVGVSLKLIFSGLSSGNSAGFLTTLREGAAAMRAFLESSRGQAGLATLRDLLQNSLQKAILLVTTAWREFGPAIMEIMPLVTQLGWAFANVLVVAMQILGPIVRGVANALSFLAPVIVPLMTVLFSMGVASKVLSVGLMVLVRGFMLVSSAISAVTTVWKVLQFLFLSNPWVALISFIVLLVVLIITNWDTIKTYLAAAWEWIRSTAITVWGAIVDFFTGLWDGISAWWTSTWNTIKAYLLAAWTVISTVAMSVWNGIVNFFTTLWTIVSTAWMVAWTAIKTFLVGLWQGIVGIASTIWNGIVTVISNVWNVIFEILRWAAVIVIAVFFTIFGPLINAAIAIWTQISTFLQNNWTTIVAMFQAIWNVIVLVWQTIWNAIVLAATTVWTFITTYLSTAWNNLVAIFTAVWNVLVTIWTTIWNAVSSAAIAVWNTITAFLTGVWNGIVGQATALWNAVYGVISGVWNRIWGFIGPILQTIGNAVSVAWNAIVSTISNAMNQAWAFISNVWNNVVSFLTGVWSRITSAVSGGVNNVMSLLSGLWGRISGLAGSAMNLLVNAGRNIVTGLWNGIQAMGSWLYNAIMGWIRSVVPGPILQFLGIHSPSRWMREEVGRHIPTGMVEGIKKTTGKAVAGARQLAEKVANATVVSKSQIAQSGAALASAGAAGTVAVSGLSGSELAAQRASTANTTATAPAPSREVFTTVENLTLQVAGNLDPTNPLAWRQAMEGIRSGILQVEKSKK